MLLKALAINQVAQPARALGIKFLGVAPQHAGPAGLCPEADARGGGLHYNRLGAPCGRRGEAKDGGCGPKDGAESSCLLQHTAVVVSCRHVLFLNQPSMSCWDAGNY